MNEKTNEAKFLDAINEYAEKQKAAIDQEIADFKARKIEQATEQGLSDAYELIRSEVARRRAEIGIETSKKEEAMRRGLFAYREELSGSIFAEAEDKLRRFTTGTDYSDKLVSYAKSALELLGEGKLKVHLRSDDMDKADMLQKVLRNAEFVEDNSIRLGGLKVYSADKNILIDETFDTKLIDQHKWFVENSGLKVM